MTSQEQALRQIIEARAIKMAEEAVGLEMGIRIRKATRRVSGISVRGTITSCRLHDIRRHGNTVFAVWAVVINDSGDVHYVRNLPVE